MILELDELAHRYNGEQAVQGVSFVLEAGELVALLGPSGCGKTTIVQAIAGHVSPTGGRVRLRGEDVTGTPPESRRVGLVFQRPTLYPHMTVRENVAYGLTPRDIGPEECDAIVSEHLDLVDLEGYDGAYPSELSRGQQRRVELARALAPEPDVLLLDEPLSGLDRNLRERLRGEVARIQRETGVSTLFVTHDQEEAMALADRIVVMNDGGVAGIGEPRELYESPPSPFVGSFLGRSNTVPATVVGGQPLAVELGGTVVRLPEAGDNYREGSSVVCHVRPDEIVLRHRADDTGDRTLTGTVARVADLGRHYDVTVRLPTDDPLVVEQAASPPETGDEVAVVVPEQSVTVFADETG
jgi:ABC-type Fe3+/spermidine/putrescine transport system ATPase subunit